MPLQCFFECEKDGTLYSFPIREERFNAWKAVLHPLAQEFSKEYICRHFRLCYRHFKNCYILPSQRLTTNAVPTLKLLQYGGNDESIPNTPMEVIRKYENSETEPQNIEQKVRDINVFEPLVTKAMVEVSEGENISMYLENIKECNVGSDLDTIPRYGEQKVDKAVEENDENIEDIDELKKEESVTETLFENKGQSTNDYENQITTFRVYEKEKQESEKTHCKFELEEHRLNLKVILESSNANLIRSNSLSPYTCFFCKNYYKSSTELKEHTVNNHTSLDEAELDRKYLRCSASKLDITDLHCKLCNNNIDTLNNFIHHLKDIHKKKIFFNSIDHILPIKFINGLFQCGICTVVFRKFRILLSHFAQTHYRNYVCNECDMGFVNKPLLQHHILKIHKLSFICVFCSKKFNTKFKRDKHENLVHSHLWTFKCDFCEKRFKHESQKERHTFKDHSKEPSNKNEDTSKVVLEAVPQYVDDVEMIEIDDQTDDLPVIIDKLGMTDEEKYKNVHNIKTILECTNATLILSYEDVGYTCYFCSKYYKDPSKLKEHATNTHTIVDEEKLTDVPVAGYVGKLDVTDLYCKLCYRYIDTLQDLSVHVSEHGKKIFVDVKTQIVPLKFQKGIPTCCICSKTYNEYHELVEHSLIYYLDYLRRNHDLGFMNMMKLHERVHEVRQFPCQFCPRIFDNALNKAEHENKVHHYKLFKYKCEVCNERFQFVKHKDRHLLKDHNIRNINKIMKPANKYDNINGRANFVKPMNNLDKEHSSQCEDLDELSDDEEQDTDKSDSSSRVNTNILGHVKTPLKNSDAEIITRCKNIVELLAEEQKTNKRHYRSQVKTYRLSEEDKHFNNIKIILECTNASLIRSREDLGYTCLFCNKFYKSLSELKEHAVNTHANIEKLSFTNIGVASYVAKLDITGLKCKLCSSVIDTIKNLFLHLQENHKKDVYIELRNQILTFKLNGGLFQCCMCFQDFKKFQCLLYHMQKHYRNYVCKCDKSFDERSDLVCHLTTCKKITASDIRMTLFHH